KGPDPNVALTHFAGDATIREVFLQFVANPPRSRIPDRNVRSSIIGNPSRLPPAGLLLLGTLLLVLAAGCQEKEGIQHYRVDKIPEPEAKARLLAVIFPVEQHTWFFKLVGPIETVDEHAKEFIRFVNSIRFPEGAGKPTWQLPQGWSEEPGS